ncbi:tRNA threonylcarbamoyladenosine biosynthesis protein TsaB [Micrococcales bacterium KH10]|nr:tRNA threonylcarbamoyladenosine biosynthesis protein TsaB [Micrococcales bacterium KH10]
MVTLALDTSNGIAVGVTDGSTEMATRRLSTGRQHAELLSPLIDEVLHAANVSPQDITEVVVGTGPAPFTGLRAGLVAARTFAFGRGIDGYGVCSLDAVALAAVERLDLGGDQFIAVLSDARRKEVYGRTYRVSALVPGETADVRLGDIALSPLSEPWVERPGGAVSLIEGIPTVVSPTPLPILEGSGIEVTGDDFVVEPRLLAIIAQQRLAAGVDQPVEPLYLRRPDAQVPGPAKKAV